MDLAGECRELLEQCVGLQERRPDEYLFARVELERFEET